MSITVLVTGAGGPAGVSVIRALKSRGDRVVAVDADPLAVGLRLADACAVVGAYGAPGYVESLCETGRRQEATALISTLAEEVPVLTTGSSLLSDSGMAYWLPPVGAVEACIDKWAFAAALRTSGVAGPATGLGQADGVPGPWVVKPRFGRGSRDVYLVDDADEMEWALRRVVEPLVQTRLTGREFTVDALVDRTGMLAGAVPRWRLETKAGISTKGMTFTDAALSIDVGRVLTAVGLRGPANVQGFIDEAGETSIVEVNPRFSGGLPLSLAAGADLVGEYMRGVQGESIRGDHLTFRSGVVMMRHFEEVFEQAGVGAGLRP